MKTKVIITILILSYQFSFSQKEFKLDNDSFMLGMFNDYNGREIALDHPFLSTQVTSFYCSEKKLEKMFLDSIQKKYKFSDIIVKDNIIYSKSLAKLFNKYYYVEKSDGGWTYDGIDYSAYMMKLKKKSFTTNQQKISFVFGSYFRNGKKENGELKIVLANSLSHFDALEEAMKKLKFKLKVETNPGIPATQIIYFKPTKKYYNLFMNIEPFKPDVNDCN